MHFFSFSGLFRLSSAIGRLGLALLATGATAHAADVSVVGLFPNKAVLIVDGGSPKTYSVGSNIADGIKLISANESSATIDTNGKRQTIGLGEQHVSRAASNDRASTTLQADGQGHYVVSGQINGGSARMLLDTGASFIALPASDASRLGIDYRHGQVMRLSTANGVVPGYRVMLNTVKVGDIEINQVEAVVQESGLPFILLGNSFLNRMELRRDGTQMVLTKRF